MEELIFGTERKEKKKSKWFYWNVCDLVAAQSCPETLLFAHVWTGCDTTSAIHQKDKFCYWTFEGDGGFFIASISLYSKKTVLKNLGYQFRELATQSENLSRNQQGIGEAGIQLMINRYALGKFLRGVLWIWHAHSTFEYWGKDN